VINKRQKLIKQFNQLATIWKMLVYKIGEGSGYVGSIFSSAADGIRVGMNLISTL
jgi:uncharacterized FAD-dependent dehydrogenase